MKILFLGTGAADWQEDRSAAAETDRRFSSALIDGELLIDPGPHVPEALNAFGVDPKGIRYIIHTHDHSDHFCWDTVYSLAKYGAQLYHIKESTTETLGKYNVTALKGNHATCKNTVHFLISDGEKTLFYGLDGAWLLQEEAEAIKKARPALAVLDGTIGFIQGDWRVFEHNDLFMVLSLQKALSPWVGRFCVSHMARTLHTDHETLCAALAPYGVTAAHDGMELTL